MSELMPGQKCLILNKGYIRPDLVYLTGRECIIISRFGFGSWLVEINGESEQYIAVSDILKPIDDRGSWDIIEKETKWHPNKETVI